MNAPKVTILVIEDDEAVRQTLTDMLELNGYSVAVAANGEEGLICAREEKPAVIITDLSMPGLNGFELLQRFRDDGDLRNVPVIVISAKMDRADTRRGMDLGAADYITKPFTESEVIRSIAARLEKKELLDELDAFAHTVAHDLKNPLAVLNGRLYLAANASGENAFDETQKHVAEAARAANRIGAIIDELLVLSGVRRHVVEREPIDTAAVIDEALERLETLLEENPATIEKPDRWPVAYGHAPWVVHVWMNYLSNAIRYAGPNARISLGAEARPERSRVRFWVQDRGPGLDEAARRKMFVPFTSISTVRAKGHGLGLSIVRRIAERLGGAVGVDSEVGKGSRFWFELPATKQT